MIQAEDTARLYAIAEQFLQTLQYTPHGKFWPAAILFHGREKTVQRMYTKDGVFTQPQIPAQMCCVQHFCNQKGFTFLRENVQQLFFATNPTAVETCCVPLRRKDTDTTDFPLLLPAQKAPFPAFGIYEDGRIVCCAAPSAATYFRGFSELCVYTVPAYRNRGYGTQCIRAMTSAVCAAGRTVLYRTDVSNVAASHTAQAAGLHYAGNAHILLYARQT